MSPNFNAVKTRSEIKTRNFSTLTFSAFTCAAATLGARRSAVNPPSPLRSQARALRSVSPSPLSSHCHTARSSRTDHSLQGGEPGRSGGGAGEEPGRSGGGAGEETDQGCTAEANNTTAQRRCHCALWWPPAVPLVSSRGSRASVSTDAHVVRIRYFMRKRCLQSLQEKRATD